MPTVPDSMRRASCVARSRVDGDNYLQHHPQIADVASSLKGALEAMAKAGMTTRYDRIHRVLGEGNFVPVVSESTSGGNSTAFYDLFRVQKRQGGRALRHRRTHPAAQRMEERGRQVLSGPIIEEEQGMSKRHPLVRVLRRPVSGAVCRGVRRRTGCGGSGGNRRCR